MSGITMSEATARFLRMHGNELAALREDYAGGRLTLAEFGQRVSRALGLEDLQTTKGTAAS